MKNYKKTPGIVSFANLTFYPMTAPNTGCIAQSKLSSGYDITVTGGNVGQHADGIETFLVEVRDARGYHKDDPKIVTKRNMNSDELSLLIEHHYRNRFKRSHRR
jgi:hypothetical protein